MNKNDTSLYSLKYPQVLRRSVILKQWEDICLSIQSDTQTEKQTEGIVSHLSPMHSWIANEVNVFKWVAVIHSENKIADSFLTKKCTWPKQ